jgi:hypothetical protein
LKRKKEENKIVMKNEEKESLKINTEAADGQPQSDGGNAMDSKEFKNVFDKIAKVYGFERLHGCWYKDSAECIVVLDLQKSNFGDYYEMNIKIFIQGMLENNYIKNKNTFKKDVGDVFRRQPQEFSHIFDFDEPMNDRERENKLEQLFKEFIVPFTEKSLSKSGIKELEKNGTIYLLPSIKSALIIK